MCVRFDLLKFLPATSGCDLDRLQSGLSELLAVTGDMQTHIYALNLLLSG